MPTLPIRFSLKSLPRRSRSSPPIPESSIPLRVLVQALVTVGIVATDLATSDITGTVGATLWAIPVSLLGAAWSYRQRHRRNIPVKFGIALGMLIALGFFFVQLWVDRHDTRLALTTLLVHLQVLHSFDLPRRKDLSYSIVIGLILLSVAASLSQTLGFAPLLLVFLLIAIPILVLDYRSRLGLSAERFAQVRLDLAPRRLGSVLVLVVALGLLVFLLLPRFPGYQLRSFPVSAPIDVNGQFDRTAVLNPGYVQNGQDGTTGAGGGTTPGEFDDEQYYGFSSPMNQNLRGDLEPKVILRVRSQAPGFWRALAFDRYTGQGWEITRNTEDQVRRLSRSEWSYRFFLPGADFSTRSREVVQSYTILADLPNLIPALYAPRELYFPTSEVALDQEGGLRSPVPLSEGLTYTVVSDVPYRDRTQLQQAPTSIPAEIAAYYLQLPPDLASQLRQTTENILARSPKPITSAYEQALYLTQYLKQNYSIQPELPFFQPNEDLATAFLFTYGGGYPDHFSTVLTLLLRSIDIPARLVVGFDPGDFNPFTGFYEVKNTDAYALSEVYFPDQGWFTFDPIPGHDLFPPSIEESKVFGVLQQFWNWVAGWLPSPVTGMLQGVIGAIGAIVSRFIALFTEGWLGILTALGGLTAIGFCAWLAQQGWRFWRYRRWLSRLPVPEAYYQQMLHLLHQHGRTAPGSPVKSPSQTPLEFAASCRRQYPSPCAKAIERISHAYVHWRYGKHEPDIHGLAQGLQELRTALRRHRQPRWPLRS